MKVVAAEAIRAAVWMTSGTRSLDKPGAAVSRLGKDYRDVLRELKSDDDAIRNPARKLLALAFEPALRWGRRSKRWS